MTSNCIITSLIYNTTIIIVESGIKHHKPTLYIINHAINLCFITIIFKFHKCQLINEKNRNKQKLKQTMQKNKNIKINK